MKPAADPTRKSELARIHIAKQQLGLDDETYRSMLWAIARVNSAADLDWSGRKRVLDHLKRSGFKPTLGKTAYPGRPHNADSGPRSPQLLKVEALLADAGRPWAYADGMAQRMFHVDRVALCHEDQLQRLIAALVYDQRRRNAKESTR